MFYCITWSHKRINCVLFLWCIQFQIKYSVFCFCYYYRTKIYSRSIRFVLLSHYLKEEMWTKCLNLHFLIGQVNNGLFSSINDLHYNHGKILWRQKHNPKAINTTAVFWFSNSCPNFSFISTVSVILYWFSLHIYTHSRWNGPGLRDFAGSVRLAASESGVLGNGFGSCIRIWPRRVRRQFSVP